MQTVNHTKAPNAGTAFPILLMVLGGLGLIIALSLQPALLRLFDADGIFSDDIMQRITYIRWGFVWGAGLLIALGFISYTWQWFNFLNGRPHLTNRLLLATLLLAMLGCTEWPLRIRPLLTTTAVLVRSVPYLPSAYSIQRLDTTHFEVKLADGSPRLILETGTAMLLSLLENLPVKSVLSFLVALLCLIRMQPV